MSTSQTKESGQALASILIAASARIAVPVRWTQGTNARDAAGVPVCSTGPLATCWCSFRSILIEGGSDARRYGAVALVERANDLTGLIDWNDEPARTHAEVLAAFDRAIELAKAEADQ